MKVFSNIKRYTGKGKHYYAWYIIVLQIIESIIYRIDCTYCNLYSMGDCMQSNLYCNFLVM